MADEGIEQPINADGWVGMRFFLDKRPPTQEMIIRRNYWAAFGIVFTLVYLGATIYHLKVSKSHVDLGYLIVLGVMLVLVTGLAITYACDYNATFPEFRFRVKYGKTIAKVVCDFVGVYGGYYILKSITKHTAGVCWIYVSCSGFTLAAFKFVSPGFDFSAPSLLVQIALNEAFLINDYKWLKAMVIVVCFAIFFLQANLDIKWKCITGVAEGDNEDQEDAWIPWLFIINLQSDVLKFRRLCWLCASVLCLPMFIIGYTVHNDKISQRESAYVNLEFWVPGVVALVISVVLFCWSQIYNLREIKFRHKNLHLVAKTLFDFGQVFACFGILASIKEHTEGLCWVFVAVSMYTLTFFKVISPSFDFSLPSLFAQIAMNESVYDKKHSDLFPWLVGVACFLIFVLQAFIDIHWELVWAFFPQFHDNAGGAGEAVELV